jgi:hypothetical protein
LTLPEDIGYKKNGYRNRMRYRWPVSAMINLPGLADQSIAICQFT